MGKHWTALAILGWACSAGAATNSPCVSDLAGLQNALNAAVGDTDATDIRLVRGAYQLGGTPISFESTQTTQGQLDLSGGYNADCSEQIKDPSLTVLDAQQMSYVLAFSSPGGISVRYLTAENASATALTVYSGTETIFDYNIVRDNTDANFTTGAGMSVGVTGSSTGDVHVDGNLLVSNSTSAAGRGSAAGDVFNEGTGNIYFTNNTIADNTLPAGDTSECGGITVAAYSGTAYLGNNIAWHNSNCGFLLQLTVVLVDNDYGSVQGTIGAGSSGNQSIDPQFAGVADYHLQPTSPLLGQGTISPEGGLPSIDLEGHPRSYGGLVDMGAYERGDEIFADGFDD